MNSITSSLPTNPSKPKRKPTRKFSTNLNLLQTIQIAWLAIIANTTRSVLTERTREIGIRKALGAKPRDILSQFLVEAFVLSVGGGLIGVILGMALAFGVGAVTNITPIISLSSIALAFGFSAAVGIFFGYYPALRAAKLDPVESLRYE